MSINYSIIIPHKNIPKLLVRCINSIPERDDIQIVIVDDDSDDADSYLEKYPELFRHDVEFVYTKEAKGAGYARNIGLKHAKGKWIVFADADDFFLPKWTEITDQYLDTDADVIQFRIEDIITYKDCRWHNASFDEYAKGIISDRDLLFFHNTCWAKMLKAEFIRNNEILFEEIKFGNDVFFGYKVAALANHITISQSAIYDLTYREGSLTTINGREVSWIRYLAGKKANDFAAQHGYKRYELPHAIEVLKNWRKLGLRDYYWFIWHERCEIRRASSVKMNHKPFNYRHPYLYMLLVLFRLL